MNKKISETPSKHEYILQRMVALQSSQYSDNRDLELIMLSDCLFVHSLYFERFSGVGFTSHHFRIK